MCMFHVFRSTLLSSLLRSVFVGRLYTVLYSPREHTTQHTPHTHTARAPRARARTVKYARTHAQRGERVESTDKIVRIYKHYYYLFILIQITLSFESRTCLSTLST